MVPVEIHSSDTVLIIPFRYDRPGDPLYNSSWSSGHHIDPDAADKWAVHIWSSKGGRFVCGGTAGKVFKTRQEALDWVESKR
jgi:hypothetical protein